MSNYKRFELDKEIQTTATAPKITLQTHGTDYMMTIAIVIKGKNLPGITPPPPDPEEDTHRDMDLLLTNLYVGDPYVTLEAPPGTHEPTVTVKILLKGKIPGTTGYVPIQ
jgi:hypothetical protein